MAPCANLVSDRSAYLCTKTVDSYWKWSCMSPTSWRLTTLTMSFINVKNSGLGMQDCNASEICEFLLSRMAEISLKIKIWIFLSFPENYCLFPNAHLEFGSLHNTAHTLIPLKCGSIVLSADIFDNGHSILFKSFWTSISLASWWSCLIHLEVHLTFKGSWIPDRSVVIWELFNLFIEMLNLWLLKQ